MPGSAKKKQPPFEFVGVMQEEAAELDSALKQARILHSDRDIDAGEHHYEDAVRAVLQKRLPARCDLGKGHVVDHGWESSKEFDVVIADVSGGSIFFTASDGTRYYPYGGVYGLGEVKSSFRRSEHQLQSFIRSVADVKARLRRERTPSNYIPGIGPIPQVHTDWPYRNPLFTFAIFGEGRDVQLEDVVDAYAGVPWEHLPNVVCFLDWGVVALCELIEEDAGQLRVGPMVMVPEFADTAGGKQHDWVRLPMGQPEVRKAANLATLEWAILGHCDMTALMPGKPMVLHTYLQNAGLIRMFDPEGITAVRPPGDKRPETLRG